MGEAADDTVLQGTQLRLRRWRDADLAPFAAMNASAEVMRHFVAPLSRQDSDAMAARIAAHHQRRGYGWWVLQTPALVFAGCVGLIDVAFELPGLAPPQVEIGWRLVPEAWGHGHASAAARLVLEHARHTLALPRVVSFTALANRPSMAVMQRIGMAQISQFEHPRIPPGHPLATHVLYSTQWPLNA